MNRRSATKHPSFHLRGAAEQDCAEIARLAGQLGYAASAVDIRKRLRRLLGSGADAVFVAESDKEGRLAGWIHGNLSQYLESEYRVEIGGLVVDTDFHRNGVGCALVARIEGWGKKRGAAQITVRCQTKRTLAHLFYESLRYIRTKTQIVFRKTLD